MRPSCTLRVLLPILLVTATAAGGCAGDREAPSGTDRPPRLVLLYATCTVGAGALSPYDPSIPYTPNLEAFARRAAVLEKHRTEAGLSGVAFASILTGLQAPGHGVYTHPTPLSPDLYDLTEAFADGGFRTLYWHDHSMAAPSLGYGQGVAEGDRIAAPLVAKDRRFRELLAELAADPDARAFVLTAFTVTHAPYGASHVEAFCHRYPGECRPSIGADERARWRELYRRERRGLQYDFRPTIERLGLGPDEVERLVQVVNTDYRSNVFALDQSFGAVLAAIEAAGLADDALVLFTADHGESLYDSRSEFHWSHGHNLEPEVLEVPLLVRGPGIPPARHGFVSRSVDLFPTLAGLAELGVPEGLETVGSDLSPVLRGAAPPPDLPALSHAAMLPPSVARRSPEWIGPTLAHYFPQADMALTWVAIRSGDRVWKYRNVDGERFAFQAFDKRSDPDEHHDLFDPEDRRDRAMARRLADYHRTLVQSFEARSHDPQAADAAERLRSLGYLD